MVLASSSISAALSAFMIDDIGSPSKGENGLGNLPEDVGQSGMSALWGARARGQ
jgi:hypothetical protein